MNEKIILIFRNRLDRAPTIDGNTRFREELALTSLEYMMLMYDMEKEFNITIDFFDFAKCTTVNDLSELVSALVEKAGQ